jgi:hypothetical protein
MTEQAPTQPTAEEQQQAQAVAAAGAEAAARGEDAGPAMREKRDEVGLKMSDEDINRIAERLNALNIAELEKRGAFMPPPEPTQPPPSSQGPPPPSEGAPPGEQPPAAAPQQPQKRSAAQRFMGL